MFGELDWLFLIVLLLSTLLGLSRGMVREVFALIGWISAFFVSMYFSDEVAAMLPFGGVGPMVKTLLAVVFIVIGCVFASGIVGKIIRSILASASIGAEDRILGSLFGFCRGLILVGFLVYLGGHTQFISSQSWWKDSHLVPLFTKAIVVCSPYLPESFSDLKKN